MTAPPWEKPGKGKSLAKDLDVLQGPYLAGYTPVQSPPVTYGLQRLDHAVGNVHKMQETVDYIAQCTGFHQFAEFTAEVQHNMSQNTATFNQRLSPDTMLRLRLSISLAEYDSFGGNVG